MASIRLIALMATYNEALVVAASLEHLIRQGAEVYLIDNESTDGTVTIAERFRGRGLIDIAMAPRPGVFDWAALLTIKERMAAILDADWFMHVDADEFHMPPRADQTLVEALGEVDVQGNNAVSFLEFTFVPTREAPDHSHPNFEQTMHWYYLHQSDQLTFMRAWKKQAGPVGLAASAGHRLEFPGLRLHPQPFYMRHYQYLSVEHAIRKYVQRHYSPAAIQRGWHGWRPHLKVEAIPLPPQAELTRYAGDGQFDLSRPRSRHIMAEAVELSGAGGHGVVCIAGMHRSGTSMVARLLNLTGLYLGLDTNLIPADQHNQDGYWEHTSFMDVNDAILSGFGGGWDMPPALIGDWDLAPSLLPMRVRAAGLIERFAGHAYWGWKDPRTLLTWRFWKRLIPDLKLVICLRNPLEVAESLLRRDHSSSAFGIKLWLDYNQRLLSEVRPEDRIVTHYDSFFHDARSELRRLTELLQLPVTETDLRRACMSVSPQMRHQRATTQDLLRAGVSDEVFQLYSSLCAEAGPICQLAIAAEPLVVEGQAINSNPATPRYLDALRQAQLQSVIDQLKRQLDENELRLARLTEQLQQQTQFAQVILDQSAEKTSFITGLKTQVTDLTQAVQLLSNELAEAESQQSTRTTPELEAIRNAKFWRVMMVYWRARYALLHPYRAFREWLRDSIPFETRRAVLDRLPRKSPVQMPGPVVQRRVGLTLEKQRTLTSLLRKLTIEVSAAEMSDTLAVQMTEPDWANLQSLLVHLHAVPSENNDFAVVNGADLPPCLMAPNPLTLLFICGEFPNPLHGGGWRVYDQIKTLGKTNNLYLYTWYQPARDNAALEDLRPHCKGIKGVSMSEFESGNAAAIRQLTGDVPVDIVSYEWPRAMLNYTGDRKAKHILTLMEVTSLRLRMDMDFEPTMSPRWTQIFVDLINALKKELVDAAKMDARIVVTHRDGAFLAGLDSRQKYIVINTGIKIEDFSLPDCVPEPQTLVFVGNYLHYPNEDAVKYFFNHIYPAVKARIPGTKVLIVGEGPTQNVKAFHDGKSVIVTGKVADVRPYIQRAVVCLAPLITGAGYRGKVHQYSALRRVCVATSNAVVDMAYQNGKDIFVTDDTEQFAERIVYLLQHPDIARQMGDAAFATVCASHGHQRAIDQTYRVYQHLLNSSAEMTMK